MENTSAAAFACFVAPSRIAGDHDTAGLLSTVRGTGPSLTAPWSGVVPAAAANAAAMRRVPTASEHNYIDVVAMTKAAVPTAALAKQGAPPRGEPR